MRVVSSGAIFDARTLAPHQRWTAFTAVTRVGDGTLLCTFRRGSQRDSLDGHVCVFASTDQGETWEERYDGSGKTDWNGVPGEDKALLLAEVEPGRLVASGLWVDRSEPSRPWIDQITTGLSPMRTFQMTSVDGGRTWGPRRQVDLAPHPAASPTGPVFWLATGELAQPYEHWKDAADSSPGRPAAYLRLSRDRGATWPGFALVARHPDNALFYWDLRLAVHPTTGQFVGMFWTHDPGAGQDVDIHITWGSSDGRRWEAPVPTGLPGQHCQPIPVGGDRLAAAYVHRKDPPGIRVALSADFGRTWDRASEVVVYDSSAGTESGADRSRSLSDYWSDMNAWRFGHPRGVLLPDGPVLVVYYAGDQTTSVRWAKVAV
jgi:hypothetical protein